LCFFSTGVVNCNVKLAYIGLLQAQWTNLNMQESSLCVAIWDQKMPLQANPCVSGEFSPIKNNVNVGE
jgi:hypothetical protein